MKETIKKNVSLLKKHGRYCIFVMALFASIFCLIAAFFAESVTGLIVALAFSFINVCQAFYIIINTRNDDSFQTMKEMYENVKDDLCIAQHKIDSLQQELESMKAERDNAPAQTELTQTSLSESMKEIGPISPEFSERIHRRRYSRRPLATDVAQAETKAPKPAPKRKPKTKTETENGNKENSLD